MKFCDQDVTTDDYRNSMYAAETDDMFTLAYQWQDKKHRHVHDLCNEIDRLNLRLRAAIEALKRVQNCGHMGDVVSIATETIAKIEEMGGKGNVPSL